MTISQKEREASTIELDFMARKYARWANERIGQVFKARISGTDPELKADLHDEIVGAQLFVTSSENIPLFSDVKARIDKVDIAKAKIYVSIVGEDV